MRLLIFILMPLFFAGCPFVKKDSGGFQSVSEELLVSDAKSFNSPAANPSYSRPDLVAVELPGPEVSTDNYFSCKAHAGEINALVLTKNGKTAYSAGSDGRVLSSEFVKLSKGKSACRVSEIIKSSKPILALSLSQDEKLLAVSGVGVVGVYDVAKKKFVERLTSLSGRVTALAWDPKGEYLAIGLANGEVFTWKVFPEIVLGVPQRSELETYPGGISPIVSILFHPSARTFFVVEKEGTIYLWRLLRTARELGLRDDEAKIDEKLASKTRWVGGVGNQVALQDAWLDEAGFVLSVASSDGKVFQWKVRGGKAFPALQVETGAVSSVSGFDLPLVQAKDKARSLLVTASRARGLNYWCRIEGPEGPSAFWSDAESEIDLRNRIIKKEVLVGVTPLFSEPVSIVRFSADSRVLWAAQKTGNLLNLSAEVLWKGGETAKGYKECKGGT